MPSTYNTILATLGWKLVFFKQEKIKTYRLNILTKSLRYIWSPPQPAILFTPQSKTQGEQKSRTVYCEGNRASASWWQKGGSEFQWVLSSYLRLLSTFSLTDLWTPAGLPFPPTYRFLPNPLSCLPGGEMTGVSAKGEEQMVRSGLQQTVFTPCWSTCLASLPV